MIREKQPRSVKRVVAGVPTTDGAGVKLKRILGTPELDHLDPFLLLDEFRSENPDEYIAGFPSHPHRGFETVTYLKRGNFRHRDSRGNEGFLRPGSVQWMTAGRGIIHSEMPEIHEGLLWGYQLWLNLPARLKMVEPEYQDIPPEVIPAVEEEGVRATVICGEFRGTRGPARARYPVTYLDVELRPGEDFRIPVPESHSSFVYVYAGRLLVGSPSDARHVDEGHLAILGSGDRIEAKGDADLTGLLLLAAEPVREPVARAGPFVMNTREELHEAFRDYQSGRLG